MRYRIKLTAVAAAVLVVCGVGFAAISGSGPAPDRVQYAHQRNQPLTATEVSANETAVAGDLYVSAGDSAAIRTQEVDSGDESVNITLAQPEDQTALCKEISTPVVVESEIAVEPESAHSSGATPEPVAEQVIAILPQATPEPPDGMAEEALPTPLPGAEIPATPEPVHADAKESAPLCIPEPLPQPSAVIDAGQLQFSVEEAVYNEELGYLLLRCVVNAKDWMQVSTAIPSGLDFTESSVSVEEISSALDRMLAASFGEEGGLRLAQLAEPEILLSDGTRPLATRMTETEDGAQELLLAFACDPKTGVPEDVNVGLHLNAFLVNADGECLAVYSEPIPLSETGSGSLASTGARATAKAGAYMHTIPIDVPVTRVRGGTDENTGISRWRIVGFDSHVLLYLQQEYDPEDAEMQKILAGDFILTLADGMQLSLPIRYMTVDLPDQSAYWEVGALLSAEECLTGDPATCRITALDEEASLSTMFETEQPLERALELALDAPVSHSAEESTFSPTAAPENAVSSAEESPDGPTSVFEAAPVNAADSSPAGSGTAPDGAENISVDVPETSSESGSTDG